MAPGKTTAKVTKVQNNKVTRAQARPDTISSVSSKSDAVKCSHDSCKGRTNEALQCFECKNMYHYDCLEISCSIYKSIIETSKVGVRWHCSRCLQSSQSQSVSALQSNLDVFKQSMNEQLKTITESVQKQLQDFKSQIIDGQNNCQKTYATALSESLDKQHTQTNQVVVELKRNVETLNNNVKQEKIQQLELKLKEKKRNNVILFNLPESTEESPESAYKEDFSNTLNAIDPNNELLSTDITDLYRIGQKQESKERPVIIRFRTLEKRNEILNTTTYYHKQTDESTDEVKKVKLFLQPDRTKKEVDKHKELRNELNRRKLEGETNIFIQNGKIVERDWPFRFKPQDYWGKQDTITDFQANDETKNETDESATKSLSKLADEQSTFYLAQQ